MNNKALLLVCTVCFFACTDNNTTADADSSINSDADVHSDSDAIGDSDIDTESDISLVIDSDIDINIDRDHDGYPLSDDCDDNDPSVNPEAEEICDGIDNNCNGITDEGFDIDLDGYTSCGGDCNDSDSEIYPEATEYCNGIDNDCDGTADNSCICYCPSGGCICVPGSERYCDTPMYSRWGIQSCNEDGLSWGACNEVSIPSVCSHTESWYSPAGVECCVESGLCCQDMWDYDGDSESWDSVGDCNAISCE